MPNKVFPIKPSEVVEKAREDIPDEVFETFNELIIKRLRGNKATIKQDDIVDILVAKGFDEGKIFEEGWLNIEKHYQLAGWSVTYEKPSRCEVFPPPPTFTFTKPH